MSHRVLITDGVFGGFDLERDLFASHGIEVVEAPSHEERELVGALQAAPTDGMLVCFAPVAAPVVKAAGDAGCKIIARYGIGVDNIDVGTATDLGIKVTNVPDYCLDEVADHTMALLLAHARGVVNSAQSVSEGAWEADLGSIERIAGRTIALVGMGGIGRRVASRAKAFGLSVVAYDPFIRRWDETIGLRAVSLRDAVQDADFISVHAPMTAENHHLINADVIASMRRRPLLINTARGGLIDLDAVVDALADGRLGGVALDVTDPEPLPADSPLRSDPRALITPHVAFHSKQATEELRTRASMEVVRALAGEPADCPVNDV